MDTKDLVSSMIDKVAAGENTAAQEDFEAALSAKMAAALDAKKVELAQSVYSNEKSEEESQEEEIANESEQV